MTPVVTLALMLAFVASCQHVGYVYRCESDGEIVKPADIHERRHVSERDEHGNILTLCGYVHRVPRSMPVM